MKNRTLSLLLSLSSITTINACAQITPGVAPQWNATATVVTEAGNPVPGATVEIWHYVTPRAGETEASERFTGLTDTNGVFRASARSRSISLGFVASKDGYYPTTK